MRLFVLVVGQLFQQKIIFNMAGIMQNTVISKHFCKNCKKENHCGQHTLNDDNTLKCAICRCAVCYPRKSGLKRG